MAKRETATFKKHFKLIDVMNENDWDTCFRLERKRFSKISSNKNHSGFSLSILYTLYKVLSS